MLNIRGQRPLPQKLVDPRRTCNRIVFQLQCTPHRHQRNLVHTHAALITLLNVLLLTFATFAVGRARGKYGVKAPASTGPVGFELAFRAHMNTIEATVIFLPVLWLAAIYNPLAPTYVSVLGYVWVVGRAWYLVGYLQAANKRGMGFMVGFVAWLGLLILACWGVIKQLLAA
jgi:glutathione S-transferase